jgi:hypothetical protein
MRASVPSQIFIFLRAAWASIVGYHGVADSVVAGYGVVGPKNPCGFAARE